MNGSLLPRLARTLAVALALLATGCGGGDAGSKAEPTLGTAAADSSTTDDSTPDGSTTDDSAADGEPTDELFAEGDLVLGTGDFDLPATDGGLAELTSYRATLVLSFDGTRDGAAENWTTTYTMLATSDPAARYLTIERTGDVADPRTVVMAEEGGVTFEQVGEDACTATPNEEGLSLGEQMEPASILVRVYGAEAAGSETIAGIETNHFTFDDQALGQQDVAPSTGEMWVGLDGALVLRYLLTTNGGPAYFGEGVEGTLSWDYQLTDIDVSLEFAMPPDCPVGAVSAPLLPDATNVSTSAGALTYQSASALADASAFYLAQLPTLGWEPTEPPVIGDTLVFQAYAQGDQTLTVIISTDAGTTTVSILQER